MIGQKPDALHELNTPGEGEYGGRDTEGDDVGE